MRETGRKGRSRRVAGLVVGAVVVSGCSGADGADQSSSTRPEASVAEDVADADGVPTTVVTTTTVAPTSSTIAPATTTTVPPPEILPLGTVWTSTALEVGTSTTPADLVSIDGELWAVGARWNGPVAWRSSDGVTWNEVAVEGPPGSGAVTLSGIVGRPDGGLLAWGQIGSACQVDLDRGAGYREVGFCRRSRPVVFLSDDGTAWRRVEPSPMQPGGDVTVVLEDLTAVGDGFVAVGTHRGPDWYGTVWSSSDGETWELARELRGVDGPMSGRQVLWDGSSLVLLAHEHPCSQDSINDNSPGWILGADWAEHLRIFAGPSVGELAAVAPGEHPLVEPPMPVDCSVDDGFSLAREPYADARGEVIAGRITLVDDALLPEPEEPADEDEEPPIRPRRLVTLIDGTWTETVTDGFERGADLLVEVDGGPALVRPSSGGAGRSVMEILLQDDDGTWTARTAERPILAGFTVLAAGAGDSVVVLTPWYADPYAAVRVAGDPQELLVWVTRDVAEDEVVRCTPAAGQVCRLADFSAVDGYPDLAGADFSGADLIFAELGAGDYAGASFAGSTLAGASVDASDGGSTFVGTDFTGADLRGAALGDLAGANLAGADLTSASLEFSAPPAGLDTANLVGARLEVVADAAGNDPSLEISLADRDLTRTRINGPLGDGEVRLTVTDLRGAVLDNTSFYAVDLTGVLLDEGVDLADVDVWDNSLCPDGQPPTDGPIGTCVRP